MADIVEHGGNGRLLKYEPLADEVTVLLDGLQFANGVAVGPDERYVLVNETGSYRVTRYWLAGDRAGTSDPFAVNLPGFPDNISFNGEDTFWLALYAPRNPALDFMADKPFLRKVVYRLPEALQPAPVKHAIVLGLNAEGEVIHNLQDASADAYAPITAVEQVGDALYFGSLSVPAIARMPAP
jgi:sugar lactone lactonase YvrE